MSDAALALLGPRRGDEDPVFPGGRRLDRPMSDMTMAAVLKRMQRGDITVHGFRSTFRDWAGESSTFPREVIEAALAHRLKDKAEAAYARGDLVTITRGPVIEGAVVWDERTAQLEVVAKGGSALRKDIARSFADTMLFGDVAASPIEQRALDLSSLKAEPVFDIRTEDGIELVTVEKLTLLSPSSLGLRAGFSTAATVIDAGSNKGKVIRVQLSWPNRTNLRNQTERHRLIANRLLDRWGLHAKPDA
ncbi:MAG: hypothetical protein D6754_03975 [Alphaproteobacteria bacterium]|nr:MAG: hypothetical protein D6754_03975 [Alphaproteobacteria bacterium]